MPASGGRLSHDRAEGEKAMGPQGHIGQPETEGSRAVYVSNPSVAAGTTKRELTKHSSLEMGEDKCPRS